MKSDIEVAIEMSRKLEALLESTLGAHGKGLHEKISSVETQIPLAEVKKLRWIATVRNQVLHTERAIVNRRDFEQEAIYLIAKFSAKKEERPRGKWGSFFDRLCL